MDNNTLHLYKELAIPYEKAMDTMSKAMDDIVCRLLAMPTNRLVDILENPDESLYRTLNSPVSHHFYDVTHKLDDRIRQETRYELVRRMHMKDIGSPNNLTQEAVMKRICAKRNWKYSDLSHGSKYNYVDSVLGFMLRYGSLFLKKSAFYNVRTTLVDIFTTFSDEIRKFFGVTIKSGKSAFASCDGYEIDFAFDFLSATIPDGKTDMFMYHTSAKPHFGAYNNNLYLLCQNEPLDTLFNVYVTYAWNGCIYEKFYRCNAKE